MRKKIIALIISGISFGLIARQRSHFGDDLKIYAGHTNDVRRDYDTRIKRNIFTRRRKFTSRLLRVGRSFFQSDKTAKNRLL